MLILEWWEAMSVASQIFTCIAIPSTLLLVIQTILLFVGLGAESEIGDGDVDVDGPDDIPDGDLETPGEFPDDVTDGTELPGDTDISGLDGLRIFTVRGIVAFFVVFGWVGAAMDSAALPLYVTIPVAFVCGFAIMFLLAWLFNALMKLRSDGNADNRNAIGQAGKVQLTIPASRTGEGKVHIMLQGQYVERDAVTDETEPIPTGHEVVVIGISGQTSLVVRRK